MSESPTSTATLSAPRTTSYGTALTFEDLGTQPGPYRLNAEADTLVRVIAGLVSLSTQERELVLAAGEETIVRAGTRHRLASVYGTARVVNGCRPASR